MPKKTNPVVLQLNTSGAWRNLVKFDGSKARMLKKAMSAGKALADIANASARIAMDDGHQTAVAHYTAGDGDWRDARTQDMFHAAARASNGRL